MKRTRLSLTLPCATARMALMGRMGIDEPETKTLCNEIRFTLTKREAVWFDLKDLVEKGPEPSL